MNSSRAKQVVKSWGSGLNLLGYLSLRPYHEQVTMRNSYISSWSTYSPKYKCMVELVTAVGFGSDSPDLGQRPVLSRTMWGRGGESLE